MDKQNTFKDNFSKQAAYYAQYRPLYPKELFEYLASLTPGHLLAWDCGTGNGQCAVQLASFYQAVYASDPSQQQIDHAIPDDRVTYKVEKAEYPSLHDGTVDIITVAQALHWFDRDRFFAEAARVLKPGGVVAVIAYINPKVSPEVDSLTDHLHDGILGSYWLAENRLVQNEYRDVSFPFDLMDTPRFAITKVLDRDAFLGHLRTWSALQRFIDTNGINPLPAFEVELDKFWKPEEEKTVTWDLLLKVGKLNGG